MCSAILKAALKKCHLAVAFTHGVISTYRNSFFIKFYLTKYAVAKVAFRAL